MSFLDLAKTRQSCRDFSNKPIEKETLDKIMETAMLAPSACNSQPWKMICAYEGDNVQKICESLQVNGHNGFLTGAKAFIAVVDKVRPLKPTVEQKYDRNRFVKYDVGELIAYITLAATDLGVDSCIIGMMDEEKLYSVLGLEKDEICTIVVALGYSDIETRKKTRKDKENIIKYI